MSRYPENLYDTLSRWFKFYDESKRWKVFYYFGSQIVKIIGLDNLCPIIIPICRKNDRRGAIKILGELIGFNTNFYKDRLSLHDELDRSSRIITIVVILLIFYLLDVVNRLTNFQLSIFVSSIINLPIEKLSIPNYSPMWWYISVPLFLALILSLTIVSYFVFIGVPIKLISRFRDTIWSETICAKTTIFMLAELSRNDVLINPVKRKFLLSRMERLAIVTKLIPLTNPYARVRSKSVDEHFGKISNFIRERENWIYSPIETTLRDLRNDFFILADVYLSGSYGMFSTNLPDYLVAPQKEQSSKSSRYNQVLRMLGFLFPLVTIGLIILIPDDKLPFDKAVKPTLVLIFISWLLLSIDQHLNLGVVKGLIDLAKGIKDLK